MKATYDVAKKVEDSWPFRENPLCPNPVQKPAKYVSVKVAIANDPHLMSLPKAAVTHDHHSNHGVMDI